MNQPLKSFTRGSGDTITVYGPSDAPANSGNATTYDPATRQGNSLTMIGEDLARLTNQTGVVVVVKASLLLCPVSRADELKRKRQIMKSGLDYIPVDEDKLAAVIAADEAYLATRKGQPWRRFAFNGRSEVLSRQTVAYCAVR